MFRIMYPLWAKTTQGRVAFALDNNRGRDGESWQAEHFVVLHDEHAGWISLQGSGSYDNSTHELQTVPRLFFFPPWRARAQTGLSINSTVNNLNLSIKPIPIRLAKEHEGGRNICWGLRQQNCEWKDRRLKGRVIYEYFMMPDFNRLSTNLLGFVETFSRTLSDG